MTRGLRRAARASSRVTRGVSGLAMWVVLCASVSPIALALPMPSETQLASAEGAEAVTVASLADTWPSELHTTGEGFDDGGLDGDAWFASVASLTDLARERDALQEEFGFDDWGDFEEWESWADLDFGLADFGDAADGSPNFDIPEVMLEAYRNAEALSPTIAPSCQVRWSIIAGIGWVESNHGRHGGARVGDDGSVSPRIIGPPLDGSPGVREIRDSDGGEWDGDRVYDRAVGPMQFIPSSWRAYGGDGNGDGVRDPHNAYDATLAAAAHLCLVSPGDYSQRGELARALFGYNRSMEYVGVVMARIDAYENNGPIGDGSQVAFGGGTGGFGDQRFDDSGYTPPPVTSTPPPRRPTDDVDDPVVPPPSDPQPPVPPKPPATPKPKPPPKPPVDPPTEKPTDPPTEKPTDPPTEVPTDPPTEEPEPQPCTPVVPAATRFQQFLTAANSGAGAGALQAHFASGGSDAVASMVARYEAGLRYDGSVSTSTASETDQAFTFSLAERAGGEPVSGSGVVRCSDGLMTQLIVPAYTAPPGPTEPPGEGEGSETEAGAGAGG